MLTRRTGLTTVNLFVKCADISSPLEAISAISSAVGVLLDVFGIVLIFLFGCFPSSDQVVVLSLAVIPGLENHGTEAVSAPSNGTKLFRIVTPLVDQVRLVEYLLRFFQADTVFSPDSRTLFPIKAAAHRSI